MAFAPQPPLGTRHQCQDWEGGRCAGGDRAEHASRPCQPLAPVSPRCHRHSSLPAPAGTAAPSAALAFLESQSASHRGQQRSGIVCANMFLHLANRAQLVFCSWLMFTKPLSCASAEQTTATAACWHAGTQNPNAPVPKPAWERGRSCRFVLVGKFCQNKAALGNPRLSHCRDRAGSQQGLDRACRGSSSHSHLRELRVEASHSQHIRVAFLSSFLCAAWLS